MHRLNSPRPSLDFPEVLYLPNHSMKVKVLEAREREARPPLKHQKPFPHLRTSLQHLAALIHKGLLYAKQTYLILQDLPLLCPLRNALISTKSKGLLVLAYCLRWAGNLGRVSESLVRVS